MTDEKAARGSDATYCSAFPGEAHHMVSRSVPGAKYVRWVEICSLCGWIDPAALDGWAENAVKLSMTDRAQRIAVSAGTEPFAFVQSSGEEFTLIEIMYQALGAASVCWVGGTGSLEFDSGRAQSVGNALWQEFNRELRKERAEAVKAWADLAYEMYTMLCNSVPFETKPYAVSEYAKQKGRLTDRFHEMLAAIHQAPPDDPTRIEGKTSPRSANAATNSDPGSRDRSQS